MLSFADRLTREAVLGNRDEKWRPRFHFSSPCGFLNDPHNPVWFRGEYHIFFQYFPQQAEAVRPKCWGHLATRDFCSWRLLPAAIAPDTELDRDGCASGSALVLGGRLWLFYTGRHYYRHPRELICAAWSDDGVHFTKAEKPVVVPDAPDGRMDFRDPFVWREADGTLSMLVGTRKNKRALLRRYTASEPLSWDNGSDFLVPPEGTGWIWECPCLAEENGETFLLASPEGLDGVVQKTVYVFGERQADGSFSFASRQDADRGGDYYAGQFFRSPDGELLSLGWMSKWGNQLPTAREGWAGIMTLPRRLRRDSAGRMRARFLLPEGLCRPVTGLPDDPAEALASIETPSYHLSLELLEQTGTASLSFFCKEREGLTLTVDWDNGEIRVENHTVTHPERRQSFPIPDRETGRLQVEAVADVCCLELCLNGLEFVTHCVYGGGNAVRADCAPGCLRLLALDEIDAAPLTLAEQ